ncbi:MAG: hypothetical protein K2X91_18000, partial [Thermoleophilia bacterium]|nr:hypothetical protein [Thermoleophilia bacterium]
MTSLRQIEANRRNAAKSTGPVTPEGKDRSRRNALVHGLAGDGAVLPDSDAALVAERLQTWRVGYELATPEDEWAFQELVVNATRVDACRARESALLAHEAARASVSWDEDRRAEAEDLAARLAGKPGRTSARLETTAAGCRWLIARWGDLARPWADDQAEACAALAADLLGLPADARDPAPWAAFGFATPVALAESEAARLSRRLADGLDGL